MNTIKLTGFDLERSRQAAKTQKVIKNAIGDICNEINCGRTDVITDILIAELTTQHRTLQQGFWRVLFGAIQGYAELEYCDARNEASVRACKALSLKLDDIGLPYI